MKNEWLNEERERIEKVRAHNKIKDVEKTPGVVEDWMDCEMPDLNAYRKNDDDLGLDKIYCKQVEETKDAADMTVTLAERVSNAPMKECLNELLQLAGCAIKQRANAFEQIDDQIKTLRTISEMLNTTADTLEESVNFAKKLAVKA